MKRLIHPSPPPSLACSKVKYWKNFRYKEEIKKKLLPAQNYLCSYCEIELVLGEKNLGYHIEHIEPKSKNSSRTLDFNNLLISCFEFGSEISSSPNDPKPISCGHAKNNKFDSKLFIKPTDKDCECYFYYELDGLITHHPNLTTDQISKANYTIDLLNLNCRRLIRARSEIISKELEIINNLLDKPNTLSCFAKKELGEIKNKHQSFFTTRRQYLQDFIK